MKTGKKYFNILSNAEFKTMALTCASHFSLPRGVLMFFLLFSSLTYAQNIYQKDDVTLQEQRAIMVLKLSKQVKWPKIEKINTFKIGIMGTDSIYNSLLKISKNRRIFDKRIEVKRINSIEEIKSCHVVYVNTTYEYLLKPILNSTKGKEVLIITEGYPSSVSMINMFLVDDVYKYDINRQFLKEANLRITPILASNVVSSLEIRDRLYKKAEQKLYIANRENNEQKKIIAKQKEDIKIKKDSILSKESSITNLSLESEIKNQKIAKNQTVEKVFEGKFKKQITLINSQQQQIDSVNIEIQNQKQILEIQNLDIKEKTDILEKKNTIINTQKKHNVILSILSCLLLTTCLFLLIAYIKNKKLNTRLGIQHVEIRQQSKLLISKNKELEQFAYITSHDLQEPLNTISSFISIINEEYHSKFDEEGKQILGFIKEGSVRMKKLIDALLQYSRLGKSKEYEDVNCMPLLNVVITDLQDTIQKSKTVIHYKDLPVIKGNEVELRLLFQNLITNGIKFRHPDVEPRIDIHCTEFYETEPDSIVEKKFWKFSVTDNGIGIAQEYQDRVFAIFQRLHSRLEYEGSGIGLAHCKKIVESHSGKIWFTSKKDSGTTFCFSIPMN